MKVGRSVPATGDYVARTCGAALGVTDARHAFVDSLLSFSETLAYDYSGEWLQPLVDADKVFRVTILQSTCPGCTPMPGIATVKPTDLTDIKTRAQSSPRASGSSPILSGDYGWEQGPSIVSFVADDFDNGDSAFGSADTLTVTFNISTNRGGL